MLDPFPQDHVGVFRRLWEIHPITKSMSTSKGMEDLDSLPRAVRVEVAISSAQYAVAWGDPDAHPVTASFKQVAGGRWLGAHRSPSEVAARRQPHDRLERAKLTDTQREVLQLLAASGSRKSALTTKDRAVIARQRIGLSGKPGDPGPICRFDVKCIRISKDSPVGRLVTSSVRSKARGVHG